MPNYITATGDIAAQPVRSRVHDAEPEGQQLLLVQLKTGQQRALSFADLPGFDEDVLAAVKAENAARAGKKYKSVKAPRAIRLLGGWGSQDAPVRWNADGSAVAVMLRAWDNKDRWLATVDLKQAKLVNQHRLHDDAWVNYSFNDFGWNKTGDSLWYLSEQSGYAHLYWQPLNGKAKKLTAGTFEVSDPVLSRDGNSLYFRANPSHPGIYNLFKLDIASGQQQQLTALTGNLSYMLSPDERKNFIDLFYLSAVTRTVSDGESAGREAAKVDLYHLRAVPQHGFASATGDCSSLLVMDNNPCLPSYICRRITNKVRKDGR